MKKTLVLLLITLFVSSQAAQAYKLRALNVQNAYIDTDNQNELRINFDWFHDRGESAGTIYRQNSFNLPRIEYRHGMQLGEDGLPVRVGFSAGLGLGADSLETNDIEAFSRSAFGFNNLGLTLEAALANSESGALTAYINQTFPLIHSASMNSVALRPVNGINAYGFQTGFEYQFQVINFGDNTDLTWYGDIGYRFDVPENGSTQHSFIYYNELVLDFDEGFGMSLGLLGNSVYTSDIGTDLRLVPGLIASVGDNSQLRVGLPFGINADSPDIGVQASLFSSF